MKVFFIIFFNLILVFGFFFLAQHKNQRLFHYSQYLKGEIKKQHLVQEAVQNFELEQNRIALRSGELHKLETEKNQTLNYLITFSQKMPETLYLTQLSQSGRELRIEGVAFSKHDLDLFSDQMQFRLGSYQHLIFKGIGKL